MEQPSSPERLHSIWERIGLDLPINESSDSASHCDQNRAVIILSKVRKGARLIGEWIELRRARLPSPQPGPRCRPQVAFTVLIQTEHSGAQTPVLAVAMHASILNRAEHPRRRKSQTADPYSTFMILKERENRLAGKLRVLSKLAAIPAGKPLRGPNPKSPIACAEQTVDSARGEMLTCWRLPGYVPDTIEAKQAEVCSQPEITVGGLGKRVNFSCGEALANFPCRVCVLINVEGWV